MSFARKSFSDVSGFSVFLAVAMCSDQIISRCLALVIAIISCGALKSHALGEEVSLLRNFASRGPLTGHLIGRARILRTALEKTSYMLRLHFYRYGDVMTREIV